MLLTKSPDPPSNSHATQGPVGLPRFDLDQRFEDESLLYLTCGQQGIQDPAEKAVA